MTDQVQPHVDAVLHSCKDRAERFHRGCRDLCHARFEVDRRNQATQFYRLQRVRERLPSLDRVAYLDVDVVGILRPARVIGIGRQMPLHRLTQWRFVDVRCMAQLYGEQQPCQQQPANPGHGIHSSASFAVSGGPPRRQKTSGSTTSS